ncbi:hypothetical protein L7F22_043566 [Adiantum nelumboides]|nr:hypothetical protein [Adiantum nelumboides]
MAKAANQDERQLWQTRLQDEFSPEIDSSLIAALVYEPGQTFDDIHAMLSSLKSEIPNGENHLVGIHNDDHDTETGSSSTAVDMENIQRALDEWKLIDEESIDPDTLRLTDEEDHGVEEDTTASQDKITFEPVAVGHTDNTTDQSSLAFLIHAFPSRTPTSLQQTLLEEGEDVTRAVDTLMTLELVESGALDEETYAEVKDIHDQKSGFASRMADDDEMLYRGTGLKKMTKKDRQRRKAQEAGIHAIDGVASSSSSRSCTPAMQKVNLTDVRKGAPDRIRLGQRLNEKKDEVKISETDAEMAARIAKEERIAAGLSAEAGIDGDDESESIRDNDWLFSSSVLEQLSLLLDYPSHKVKGVHASCHMNLRATLHRLINARCQEFTSMEQLDRHNEKPIGTCKIITENLCTLLPAKSRSEIERLLYATVGREDAVLDLAQLAERIESTAVGERTDILDPMKHERTSQVQAPTLSQQVGQSKGHFDWVGGDTPLFNAAKSSTPYASVAQRRGLNESKSDVRQYALQRLREGASSVTFPLNSAQASGQVGDTFIEPESSGPSSKKAETAAQAWRLAQEYTTIAEEYRIRRQESLAKAAKSYRSTHSTGVNKGPMRGAAAWVYAEEARRLDAKARAFALQASQATVRARMLTNRRTNDYSLPLQSSGEDGGDLVDLHGLTVHDSLTITRQALNAWWPKTASSSRPAPLHIVTGVGRHSKGQVALIRPAILALLQREQWNTREPQKGHILVLGKSR